MDMLSQDQREFLEDLLGNKLCVIEMTARRLQDHDVNAESKLEVDCGANRLRMHLVNVRCSSRVNLGYLLEDAVSMCRAAELAGNETVMSASYNILKGVGEYIINRDRKEM